MKLFPFEKNGICTKHGTKKYRERFMQNGNNHLFGKAYGKEVGVSYSDSFSHRNTNTLVVGGAGTGKTYNYIEANLLQENHSAVVVDNGGVLYVKYGDYLRKKGHNVYYIDFDNPEISCRFNPFLHELYKQREVTIEVFTNHFVVACKENIKALSPYEQNVYCSLLKMIFYYVFYSPALSDEQRNFKCVQTIIEKITQSHGRSVLDKYDCYNLFEKELNLLKRVPDDVFNRIAVCTLIDLMTFATNRSIDPDETSFIEREDTTNLSVKDFVSKQSYLFIKTTSQGDNRVSFFISCFFKMLITYSEAHSSLQDTLCFENHIQFYLDEFVNLNIADFLVALSVCRTYGIGFSIVVRTVEDLVNKYSEDDEWETVLANTDVQIFTGNLTKYTHNEMIKIVGELTFINGKQMEYGSSKTQEGVISKEPILSVEEIKNIFAENKIIAVMRDYYPMICERLNPVDYKK